MPIKFLLLLLFFLLFTVPNGMKEALAFELSKGEIIEMVNLRDLPGPNEKILAIVGKGDRVTIIKKRGNWYQVVLDKTTGRTGWIFGRYLIKFDAEGRRIPIALERIQMPTQKEVQTQRATVPVRQTQSDADMESKILEVLLKIMSSKDSLNGVNTESVQEPEAPMTTSIQEEIIPIADDNFTTYNATDEAQNYEIQNTVPDIPKNIDNDNKPTDNNKPDLTQFLIRLSSIILSCLAVALSYKAMQTAKENRRTILKMMEKEY